MALKEVRAMAQLDHAHIVGYRGTWIEKPPDGWQHDADVEMLKKIQPARKYLMNFRDECVFIYIQMQLCNYSLSEWLKENTLPSSRNLTRLKGWFKQIV
ncbi:hypothetical protein PENTCL1PPCAC_8582, partial [Pristionchus entomophagus]